MDAEKSKELTPSSLKLHVIHNHQHAQNAAPNNSILWRTRADTFSVAKIKRA